MDSAKTAAWNVYVDRVNVVLTRQLAAFAAGNDVPDLVLSPPTKAQVAIIERAMHDAALAARQQAIHSTLDPVVRAIDAIDNSKTKKGSPAIRALYADLQGVYDDLHKLKESPPAGDAPDPHAGSTGKLTTRA